MGQEGRWVLCRRWSFVLEGLEGDPLPRPSKGDTDAHSRPPASPRLSFLFVLKDDVGLTEHACWVQGPVSVCVSTCVCVYVIRTDWIDRPCFSSRMNTGPVLALPQHFQVITEECLQCVCFPFSEIASFFSVRREPQSAFLAEALFLEHGRICS